MLPSTSPIYVCGVHRSPNSNQAFWDVFENQVQHMSTSGKELFLLGDLNCDLLKNSQETKVLRDLFNLFNLKQVITKPTRVS
jgi:hypothetical protein